MRVLITGGAGFLGSHLCELFLERGHEVVCMDNLITGTTDNIAHIRSDKFEFIKHDVTEYIYIKGNLDYILHFASPASPVDYLEYPIQTLKVGSLGTHKALGLALAKGAKFLLASTSEVYGDPLVHPQTEEYWGNVNPVGPRGVYDESKRFAEAMTMAYHRYHGVDTRIVRIFNSILADETVILFNDDECHIQPVEEYANRVENRLVDVPLKIQVPAFDPQTFRVKLRCAQAFIRHASQDGDAYCITTRYGRRIRVTGDHSVFRRSRGGYPEAVPVRELKVGDYIAISAYLPVIERDRKDVNIGALLIAEAASEEQLWEYAIESEQVPEIVQQARDVIAGVLMESPHFAKSHSKRNTVGCAIRKFCRERTLPLFVIVTLKRHGLFKWPADACLRPYKGGGGTRIKNTISITPDVLWLLGLYLAEGTCTRSKGTYSVLISSDRKYLIRAKRVLEDSFSANPRWTKDSEGRAPSLYVHSKLLCYVFEEVFELKGKAKEVRVPPWIVQLPLSRLKYFLEGYREGDGTHTNYLAKRELAFNTVSEGLATDLTYILLRFGLVASVGQYKTTFRKQYGERKFPFWRVTICEVSNFDILTWDGGVTQRLNARRLGDLVWVPIRKIERVKPTSYIYDFSVSGHENFLAGLGVFAHNTFGPRMRINDGRALPTFVSQALANKPMTVFGDGSQTRSFCYVSDLIDGIYRLAASDIHTPINVGNPAEEMSMLQLAQKIIELTGSKSEIVYKPLPVDDPKVRRPDILKAREYLGWEPKVSLEEGLRKTIEWFRTVL